MDRESGLMHVHSVLSVLNHPACNFPSCHCGAVIKEAIWTVNILASNQPNPPTPTLLTNINHFIYSQEVTSCIWQVITSVTVCVCVCVFAGVHTCPSRCSLACSSFTPVYARTRICQAHDLWCASLKSWAQWAILCPSIFIYFSLIYIWLSAMIQHLQAVMG